MFRRQQYANDSNNKLWSFTSRFIRAAVI